MGVVDAAVFRPSGLHGDPRGRSAKPVKGQRGLEVTGDDGLWRRKDSPAWRSRWRSGAEGAGVALGCRGGGGMARGGLQGVWAPIKAGTGVWACVHGVIAPEIAVAQDAEETGRATISRDPGLGWGSFWKLSAHGRLSSGSCRAGWSTA